MSLLHAPTFPPLLRGEPVGAHVDPLESAVAAARRDVEPGRFTYAQDEARVAAALTLAPQMPLSEAMGALLAFAVGVTDALGALVPPEVAVHLVWPNRIKVNGAFCGTLRAAASTLEPSEEPDFLVLGLDVPLASRRADPGRAPHTTTLADEGCNALTAPELLESLSRHALVWINRFVEEGLAPVQRAWCAKCDDIGAAIADPCEGLFAGLDERGAMVMRRDSDTILIPLTRMLDPTWPTLPA